jgi:hypothetical protein
MFNNGGRKVVWAGKAEAAAICFANGGTVAGYNVCVHILVYLQGWVPFVSAI